MERFSIRIVYVFLLSLVVFFACNKKEKTSGGGIEKPITDSSYNLKNFVIQDASDGRILDFMDVHKIVQQNINEVANGNVVDTIYARIMVDITALKIKPRFYDIGRVTAIDPDTNQVRDLKKYDEKPYPTLTVTFNTGVARTFALVVSQAPANEDYNNLLKNQNIYFIKEYKITNGTNEIAYTGIKITNNQPVLQQKDPIKDTIELKVITSTAAGNKIVFAPFKYGVDATDTVVANLNPITLEFDPAISNDYKDYKTMTITFANGFVREYAVKVTIVDPNTALNQDVYWMKTYSLTNKDGSTIPIGSIQEHQFTHHTPTDLVLQKDTIELTLPTTQWDLYPISFMPATWNGSATPDTITYTTDQTDNKLVFATRADTNKYKTLTVTFSNGFKREYAVKIHQIEKKSTEVSFSNFKVMDNGAPVSYIKLDTTGNTNTDGYSIINGKDSGLMIVRPLKDWNGNRQTTLQFTGLDPAVNATLVGYKGESIGNAGASLTTDGKITIDFNSINSDSVQLVLKNANEGGETRHYKIKLLSGMLKPTLLMDGQNTKGNYTGTKDDREFKIAVDDRYVYVLIMNTTSGNLGDITLSVYNASSFELYAYAIPSGSTVAGIPIKMSTNNSTIMDIVSFNNTLYGVVAVPPTAGSGNRAYQIFKWNTASGVTPNQEPIAVSAMSTNSNGAALSLFTANIDAGNNINFYAASPTQNAQITQISASMNGDGTTPATVIFNKAIWSGTTVVSSAGYGTFLDLPNSNTGIIVGGSGYIIGQNFNTGSGGATLKGFVRVKDGADLTPIGANMEMIRDKYYFINNGVYASTSSEGHRMNIIDLGKDLVPTLNTITTPDEFYKKEVYRGAMGVKFSNTNLSKRGNVRTYKLSNGKVRIASLVAMYGFQVWDME